MAIYLYEKGSPGSRAVGNLRGWGGWAEDDPPTPDVFRCDVDGCDWEGRGDDFQEGDPCPGCEAIKETT